MQMFILICFFLSSFLDEIKMDTKYVHLDLLFCPFLDEIRMGMFIFDLFLAIFLMR